jgi:hypothetical protein
MSKPVPDSKTPLFVALALAAAGLVIGALSGSGGIKIVGALIAASGAVPAAIGMWKGIQQQTQTTLALSLGALFVSLGVAAGLLIWAIIVFVS